MTQLILIVPAIKQKFDIARAKQKIISYVGTRMVLKGDSIDEMPGLVLKELLSIEDKQKLQEETFDGPSAGCLTFIKLPEGSDGLKRDYIDATLDDEDYE